MSISLADRLHAIALARIVPPTARQVRSFPFRDPPHAKWHAAPMIRSAFAIALALVTSHCLRGEARVLDLTPVARWIEKQQSIRSIEADFTQTRSLRTLRNPLKAGGRFWFSAPASFRWQVGDPPSTVAIGDDKEITLIDTKKKTAEKMSRSEVNQQARARGFGMMEFPIAKNYKDFIERFDVLDLEISGTTCHLEILPKNSQARRFLSKIALDFDTESGQLLAFDISTREGSSMRSEFSNVRVNGKIEPSVFRYDLTGYEVTNAQP